MHVDILELDHAVRLIHQACAGRHRPFFFIVGGGISTPQVPLAKEIECTCRRTARSRKHDVLEPTSDKPIETYDYWFKLAFAEPDLRRDFLRELIVGKPVSLANFHLAHLLLSQQVASLAVTTNFDDFLSRAIRLLGGHPIVCDHPAALERIGYDPETVEITHVHGSWVFYDSCNTEEEIRRRACSDVVQMLEHVLRERSPIVIGYAGWQGDIVMTVLERRLWNGKLARALPFHIYWFCHRRACVTALPGWLTSHPNVRLIVPPDRHRSEIQLSRSEEPEPTLTAVTVLRELIKRLDLQPPKLATDPLSFFAAELRHSVPNDIRGDDPFSFRGAVGDILLAHKLLNNYESESHDWLKRVLEHQRKQRHDEAVAEGAKFRRYKLGKERTETLLAAILQANTALDGDPENKLKALTLIVEIGHYLQDLLRDAKDNERNCDT